MKKHITDLPDFDMAQQLKSEEDIAAYITMVIEDGDAVGEVGLRRVVAQGLEGQHRDRADLGEVGPDHVQRAAADEQRRVRGLGDPNEIEEVVELIERYDLDRLSCLFVNFEDPRLARDLSHLTLDQLVEKFREAHVGAGHLYFFLDEIS